MIDKFLALSSEITAFTQFDLLGTGQAQAYLKAVTDVVGQATLEELYTAYDRLRHTKRPLRAQHYQDVVSGHLV
jgi:hypothetical protein